MVGLSVVDGLLLGLLSIPSFIMLGSYIASGDLDVSWEAEGCAVVFGPIMMVLLAPITIMAISLSDYALRDASRRALYVLCLLPGVIWVFMLSSIGDMFVPSLFFGLPLLVLSAAAIPYSAIVLHREVISSLVSQDRAVIVCRACGARLIMAKEDAFVRCRRCKTYNGNPFAAPPTGGTAPPEPTEGAIEGPPRDLG